MSPRLVWSQELRRLVPAEDEAAQPVEPGPAPTQPDPSAARPAANNQTRARTTRARAAVDLSAVVRAGEAHTEAVRRTAAASRARSVAIARALEAGASLGQVADALGISRVTVLKLARSVQPDPSVTG